jgi:excinuclease UvrABC ATPase subunit
MGGIWDTASSSVPLRHRPICLPGLQKNRDLGNTVIVEHNEEAMRAAYWIVGLGLSAGKDSGASSPKARRPPRPHEERPDRPVSLRPPPDPHPAAQRAPDGRWLVVRGAPGHTL